MEAKKLIGISLYGKSSIYIEGLKANVELLPKIYPEWIIRIYSDAEENVLNYFRKRNCEVIVKSASRLHSGMFWRFMAAWDIYAERIIFRDSDSRFNIREAAAVQEWVQSGLDAHCMHDHKHHRSLPIFGGMWGIKCRVLPRYLFKDVLMLCKINQQRGADMVWLKNKVHPLIKNSLLRHSSVEAFWPYVSFPKHSEYDGFVGQQYDDEGNST